MFVANIPRRKIYEKLLEYEEHVLEIQVIARDEKSFDLFHEKYEESLPRIKEKYKEIKALLAMFFEQIRPETEQEYADNLKYYLENESETNSILKNKKRMKNDFKILVKEIDKMLEEHKTIKSHADAKYIFGILDAFNTEIPLILETKKEEIK
jgi:hypothetical protein